MTQELTTLEQKFISAFEEPTKEKLLDLDKYLIAASDEHGVEQPLYHYFAEGAYVRAITLKKNSITTSHIHKTQHFAIILKGDVTVAREDGSVERLTGPQLMITQPNTKRLIIAHEDTEWLTFHVTDKTDVAEIEKEILSEDFLEEEVE